MKQVTEPVLSPLQEQNQARPIEKFTYGIYFLGQGLVYTVVSQCLMYYYTNFVLLAPLVVSAILVAGKVWDAVNDTLFGMLVDSVKFKSGNKFLPWLRISTILIPLSTILLFCLKSDMSMPLRIVLAVATYFLWDMSYTLCDAPIFALPTTMTSNVKERSGFMTLGTVGGSLAAALATMFLVPYAENNGYFKAAIIIAVASFITMSLISFFGKERYKVKSDVIEKPASLRDTWNYLTHNKYLLFFYAYRILSGSIAVSMLIFVSKYCLGDVKYMSLVVAISVVPICILFLFSGKIFKRFDKIVIYRFCMIATVIMNTVTLFVGYKNRYVAVGCLVVIAVLAILPSILMGAIPQDCVEYGTYKTDIRKEGITFALHTFTNKLTAAFASGITGIVLTIINYDVEAITSSTVDGIWKANFIVPIIGQVVAIGFLFAYKLRDKDVQIMSDANAGKITKEEAEARLSQKY